MTEQDPRFSTHVSNVRAQRLYAEAVEMLHEYTTRIARFPENDERARSAHARPTYAIDVLELGQLLNELLSARTTLALIANEGGK